MNDLVSIVMPTYNSSLYLPKTIQSILNQSYKNWELLITDDFSKDNTWEMITRYSEMDSRIKIFKLKKNQGTSYARNNSLLNSKGRFIAFCDSDDIWALNKLQNQINFMLKNSYFFTYTNYTIVDDQDAIVKYIKSPDKLIFSKLLRNNYIGCLTVVLDKFKFKEIYFPNFRREDWALWLHLLKSNNEAFCLNENLAFYRSRPNSMSSNKFKNIYYNYLIYRKFLKFTFLKSLYKLFIFFCFHFIFKYLKKH